MASFRVVDIEPLNELVLQIVVGVGECAIAPEEFSFHGFVESFNLSVLLWGIGVIGNDLNPSTFTECSEGFAVAIVDPDPLNFERHSLFKISNEIHGIVTRFPSVELPCDPAGTVIDGVKERAIPGPTKRITSV